MNEQEDIDIISKNQFQQKERVRRSRKDCQGRDYVCGCGKMYLSYPALYTHIKTKHQGKQPQGTKKSGQNNKRGRPKLDEDFPKIYLRLMNKQDLEVLNQLNDRFEGSVPMTNRIRKEQLSKEFYQIFNQIKANPKLKLSSSSSIQMLLLIYLLNVGQFVNYALYSYFITFVNIVTDCFKNHICQILQNCCEQVNGDYIVDSKNEQQCKYLPMICDLLIRQMDYNLISLMMLDLCGWMYRNHLTHIKIELKKIG